MKLFHISDLHIGKQLKYYSLKDNQRQMLTQIVSAMKVHRPDALLISGDIYDKAMPSGDAFTLFDAFLNQISEIEPAIPVFVIAGNHDSPERLRYASSFMEKHHIYISVMPPAAENEYLKKITLEDEFGPVNFYLLPFTKPAYVRSLFPERELNDYEKAVGAVLERENVNLEERNVLLSHQFYQSQGWDTATCDSEQTMLSIGGLDRIDVSVVRSFDYVALGHLHGPQKIKTGHIRYSGSPLKYSVSEEHQKKGITVVDLREKGRQPQISFIPLAPLQNVRSERGKLSEIIERASEKNDSDFVSVTVTDDAEPYRMKEQLREVYDFILEIRVDNQRTRKKLEETIENEESLEPAEAFYAFYEDVTKRPVNSDEQAVIEKILNDLTEEIE